MRYFWIASYWVTMAVSMLLNLILIPFAVAAGYCYPRTFKKTNGDRQ